MKKFLSVYIILVVLIFASTNVIGFTIFNTVKITKVYCNFNPDWIKNGTCKLKAINRTRHEASVKAFLMKPMNNFLVNVKTYRFYNQYRPFIVSYTTNLCDYYRKNTKKNFMLKSAIEVVKQFTNLNHSCPYEGWMLLEKGIYMDDLQHAIVPAGKYKAEVKVSDGVDKNPVAHGQIYIDVFENAKP